MTLFEDDVILTDPVMQIEESAAVPSSAQKFEKIECLNTEVVPESAVCHR